MSCGKPCGCPTYRDHLLSISVAASATPTRRPQAAAAEAKERRWEKDMPAYKRLRANGVQPKQIDGSAHLEQRATEKVEVESGFVAADPKQLQRFHDERT